MIGLTQCLWNYLEDYINQFKMNAIDWYNSRPNNIETLDELLEAYAKDYYQWKELQRSLVEDLTYHCTLTSLVNSFITAGEFHISHVFNFIWPTDEEQYQEYADQWIEFIDKDEHRLYDPVELFSDLKRNPVVDNIMKIVFKNSVTLRLFVHQDDLTRLATIDFELVSNEYFKLKGIVL